jgi:hypothetical protein
MPTNVPGEPAQFTNYDGQWVSMSILSVAGFDAGTGGCAINNGNCDPQATCLDLGSQGVGCVCPTGTIGNGCVCELPDAGLSDAG